MSESRSLLQDVDDASTSDESLMQMPEDQEKGNPLLHRQRRRWYHWLGFERGRLLWALFFALGLFSVVYLLSWLAKNRELLTKLSKLDAFGGSNGSLQLMKKPEDFPIIAVVFCKSNHVSRELLKLIELVKMVGGSLSMFSIATSNETLPVMVVI